MSPYSVKVRSYFRYKGIAHEWIPRTPAVDEEYKKFARLPIIPTVATPDGRGIQDSTPIMETIDANYPEPSIHPSSPDLAFLSVLVEEFGDEWGNKLMFHYRWYDEIDQRASAQTLARLNMPFGSKDDVANLAKMILLRMSGRGGFVGSSPATAGLIEQYFFELVDILEPHLKSRKYLFGARPAFGDFGLFAQMYEASIDPTCGGILRARGPHILDWCFRMIEPRNDGMFESWERLEPTLRPLFDYIGRYFLPWTQANAVALQAGKTEFAVDLAGKTYVQAPQKYHAKSLQALRDKYRALGDRAAVDRILDAAGCTKYLS